MSSFRQISSADNAQFKQLKKLAGSARERRKQNQTLLDGVHLLQSLQQAGGSPELLLVRAGSETNPEFQPWFETFADKPALLLDAKLFDQISPVETPSGLLALINIPRPAQRQINSALLLENIQDPGNLGSILRSAAAGGIDAVYLSKGCVDAWSPKVLRGGMGAHFALDLHEHAELTDAARRFDKIIATHLDASQSLYDLDLRGNIAFVFGNEGAGLSDELAAVASHKIIIPMPGQIESLNVAAAAAICVFERVRQQR
ncbi:MAG: RNA methyltransferase [Gammaproteobacteria bacterium]|nr:RNA methyltransferase [Gammaproteobacteria bacterium]